MQLTCQGVALLYWNKKTELPNTHEKRMVESRETSQHVSQISKTEKQIRRGQQGKQIKEDRLKCSFLVDYCTPTSRKTRLKFLSVGKEKKRQ